MVLIVTTKSLHSSQEACGHHDCCLVSLVQYVLVHAPASACGGQGESEEKGSPLQIGRWQV